jgi:hypothetical protein
MALRAGINCKRCAFRHASAAHTLEANLSEVASP